MTDRPTPAELEAEIARLARALQGALDVARLGGLDALPRPIFTPAPLQPGSQDPPRPSAAVADPESRPGLDRPPAPAAEPRPAPPRAVASPPGPGPGPAPAPAVARAGLPIVRDRSALDAVLASSAPAAERLEQLRAEVIGDCRDCKLHRGRHKLVFGAGNPRAQLVFVGEGPGADEDRQGVPFVGKAGQLLTKMVEAMGFTREQVYICNVVKCRPPNNRDPDPDEVEACMDFLEAQLAIIRPRIVVSLGRHAAQTLLRTRTPITKLRGTWQTCMVRGESVDVMPTYHPSFLLREENDPKKLRKHETWSDLKQVMQRLANAP